ncbi:MAG: hypothetical protein RL375_902, partial [Pseudomonadota bacterium]
MARRITSGVAAGLIALVLLQA